jgi:hypothetical protein
VPATQVNELVLGFHLWAVNWQKGHQLRNEVFANGCAFKTI